MAHENKLRDMDQRCLCFICAVLLLLLFVASRVICGVFGGCFHVDILILVSRISILAGILILTRPIFVHIPEECAIHKMVTFACILYNGYSRSSFKLQYTKICFYIKRLFRIFIYKRLIHFILICEVKSICS